MAKLKRRLEHLESTCAKKESDLEDWFDEYEKMEQQRDEAVAMAKSNCFDAIAAKEEKIAMQKQRDEAVAYAKALESHCENYLRERIDAPKRPEWMEDE